VRRYVEDLAVALQASQLVRQAPAPVRSLSGLRMSIPIAFYSKLFNTEPARRRPGCANFAIEEPPLKLVLLGGAQNPVTKPRSEAPIRD
jgi:hypothetical protein